MGLWLDYYGSMLQQPKTVQLGHIDVRNDQICPIAAQPIDRHQPVLSHRSVITRNLQGIAQEVPDAGFVVNDQDGGHLVSASRVRPRADRS